MGAWLYIACGGAVGSVARFALSNAVTRAAGLQAFFPYGTLAINVLGGLLMGLWIGIMATLLPERARELHWLIATGILGGFTTFSTFSLDLVTLMQRGLMGQAALYAVGSVVASVVALFIGMWLTRLVFA